MAQFLLQALVLFMPILAANQAGKVARVLELPLYDRRVSKRWLGKNKTVAPYYVAPVLSWAVFYAYGVPHLWQQACAIGVGAVLGDHIKSFCKRRLGYPDGAKWLPDRFDFALGGGAAAWLTLPGVTLWHVCAVMLMALPVHYVGNLAGYKLNWRDTPH